MGDLKIGDVVLGLSLVGNVWLFFANRRIRKANARLAEAQADLAELEVRSKSQVQPRVSLSTLAKTTRVTARVLRASVGSRHQLLLANVGGRPARDIVASLADVQETPPRTYRQVGDVSIPVLNPDEDFVIDLPDHLPENSHILVQWRDANGSRNTYDTVGNTGPVRRVSR